MIGSRESESRGRRVSREPEESFEKAMEQGDPYLSRQIWPLPPEHRDDPGDSSQNDGRFFAEAFGEYDGNGNGDGDGYGNGSGRDRERNRREGARSRSSRREIEQLADALGDMRVEMSNLHQCCPSGTVTSSGFSNTLICMDSVVCALTSARDTRLACGCR